MLELAPPSAADVFNLVEGDGPWAPVVLDSPHSGTVYPRDFRASAPMPVLRTGEDFLVDALFDPAGTGARMVAARFPRTYIDPNRPTQDIDAALLDAPWPTPIDPGPKTAVGKGLVWRLCLGGVPIYDRLLAVNEVRHRIDRYWAPYRERLTECLDKAHAKAGGVWHINCHSMPSLWPEGVEGAGSPVRSDFVIGDRDGTTCAIEFREMVKHFLEDRGFSVAVNDRFKGVDIVEKCGDPRNNRHSLQIEVVRDRYMDEQRFEPNAGFEDVRATLSALVAAVCEFARRSAAYSV